MNINGLRGGGSLGSLVTGQLSNLKDGRGSLHGHCLDFFFLLGLDHPCQYFTSGGVAAFCAPLLQPFQ